MPLATAKMKLLLTLLAALIIRNINAHTYIPNLGAPISTNYIPSLIINPLYTYYPNYAYYNLFGMSPIGTQPIAGQYFGYNQNGELYSQHRGTSQDVHTNLNLNPDQLQLQQLARQEVSLSPIDMLDFNQNMNAINIPPQQPARQEVPLSPPNILDPNQNINSIYKLQQQFINPTESINANYQNAERNINPPVGPEQQQSFNQVDDVDYNYPIRDSYMFLHPEQRQPQILYHHGGVQKLYLKDYYNKTPDIAPINPSQIIKGQTAFDNSLLNVPQKWPNIFDTGRTGTVGAIEHNIVGTENTEQVYVQEDAENNRETTLTSYSNTYPKQSVKGDIAFQNSLWMTSQGPTSIMGRISTEDLVKNYMDGTDNIEQSRTTPTQNIGQALRGATEEEGHLVEAAPANQGIAKYAPESLVAAAQALNYLKTYLSNGHGQIMNNGYKKAIEYNAISDTTNKHDNLASREQAMIEELLNIVSKLNTQPISEISHIEKERKRLLQAAAIIASVAAKIKGNYMPNLKCDAGTANIGSNPSPNIVTNNNPKSKQTIDLEMKSTVQRNKKPSKVLKTAAEKQPAPENSIHSVNDDKEENKTRVELDTRPLTLQSDSVFSSEYSYGSGTEPGNLLDENIKYMRMASTSDEFETVSEDDPTEFGRQEKVS